MATHTPSDAALQLFSLQGIGEKAAITKAATGRAGMLVCVQAADTPLPRAVGGPVPKFADFEVRPAGVRRTSVLPDAMLQALSGQFDQAVQ